MASKVQKTAAALLLAMYGSAQAGTIIQEARTAYKDGRSDIAIAKLSPSASSGDLEAQFHLGEAYFHSDESKKSYELAQRWYSRAASSAIAKMTKEIAKPDFAQMYANAALPLSAGGGSERDLEPPLELQLAVKQHGALFYLSMLRYKTAMACAVASSGRDTPLTAVCQRSRDEEIATCSLSGDYPTTKLFGVEVDICLD